MITMMTTNIAATTVCIVTLALVTTSSHASFANGSALISDKPNWSRMIDVREHSESLLGSDDAPWENCTLLLVTIANVTSVFERCALMRSRPFTMCESCVNEYGVAVRIFDQLQKNVNAPLQIFRSRIEGQERCRSGAMSSRCVPCTFLFFPLFAK